MIRGQRMRTRHGVWIAVATGVAIAGTSYAASAGLFSGALPSFRSESSDASLEQRNAADPKAAFSPDLRLQKPPVASSAKVLEPPTASGEPSLIEPRQDSSSESGGRASADATTLTPIYAERQPNPALARAILQELPGYTCEQAAASDGSEIRYFYTFADLNQDGTEEAIAYLVGSYTCGSGGCTAMIFDVQNGEYTLNSYLTLVQSPIVMANTKTNGWHDLVLSVSGGGAEPNHHVLRWDGTDYGSNPSMAPLWNQALQGKALLADSITADTPAPTLTDAACSP
jgi:hypothetical protein